MRIGDHIARLNRVQRSRMFKIIASCIVVGLALAVMIGYVVVRNTPANANSGPVPGESATQAAKPAPEPTPANEAEKEQLARLKSAQEAQRTAFEATKKTVDQILAAQRDPTSVATGLVMITGVALLVIWLGLGLTYLGLGVVVGVVIVPLALAGFTDTARLSAGVVALTAVFLILMEGARAALSGTGPILSIARNMLIESVRMKVSLVFIVALIIGMAALPGTLSDQSPLRYRVQTFLQFGTTGSFWVIAILTLLFACASMAYEQREKVIWQTMTKPVAAWQYVLGKWLGLVTLSAVLMTVCATSVFLFTEHLRGKTAAGEVEPFVAADNKLIADDRLILESQVLASRVRVYPSPPEFRKEEFEKNVQARIDEELRRNPDQPNTLEWRRKVESDLYESSVQAYRAIEPGDTQVYVFRGGLGEAKSLGLPINFRYQVDAAGNRPDQIYKIGFAVGGVPLVKDVALGVVQTIPLLPTAIDADGTITVEIFNFDPYTGQANPATISFASRGLEISYSSGSYRWNYMRVMGVLWVKLAFLAMVAVWAGTFLSFPVACLISFGTFIQAEGASYLSKALEYYATTDEHGNVSIVATIIHAISSVVASMFQVYSELKPTEKLVEGLRLPWSEVAMGVTVLGGATLLLYAVAVFTLKKRELAVYSGQ